MPIASPDAEGVPALLAIDEARALLGLSRTAAYRAAACGELPTHPIRSAPVRAHRAAV